ncbi:hypothetical protein B7P43_G03734 [Cryptotermes secundus]|uniref:E3 ubiquitin-protein ligase TRIM33 n=2 Tax=Cryptotermes secundus TaxID=105785 RepID=A0A2J7R1U1_9NEOP|nr:hypothetical protein B7P43_G03734 [Cryptotermes secundus]
MLHHQQVTSSTHPQTIGADGMNTNLRGLLSHHNPHGMYTAASGQVIRVNLSGQPQQMNNVVTYRSAPGVQQYPVSLAPPTMSRYSNPHPSQHPAQHANQLSGTPHQQQQLYQLQQQQQQQQQSRISPHAVMFNNPGMRPALHARVQSPQSSNQQSQPLAQPMHQGGGVQWHIPQQSAGMVNGTGLPPNSSSQHHSASRPPPLPLPVDESFKITLKHVPQQQQQLMQRAAPAPAPSMVVDAGNKMPGGHVTSSVSKTPSPSQARVEDPEKSLDKFCQESVNDLMATIAKLDRNGIEVVPEGQKVMGAGDSPLVDSSTGLDEGAGPSHMSLPPPVTMLIDEHAKNGGDTQKDDPNEDWCAVCMDGGELVCCDKCPKVFHTYCHIPNLKAIPEESETWQCLLCTNLKEIIDAPPSPAAERRGQGLSHRDQKLAERIVLELYCQYEPSLHFRETVGPEVKEYHEKIKKPMSLDKIRRKLDVNDMCHYSNLQELVSDVRLIFRNAYTFNLKESQIYQDARTLEEFFEHLLEKWLPGYAYDSALPSDDESDSPPQKKFRRIVLPE